MKGLIARNAYTAVIEQFANSSLAHSKGSADIFSTTSVKLVDRQKHMHYTQPFLLPPLVSPGLAGCPFKGLKLII